MSRAVLSIIVTKRLCEVFGSDWTEPTHDYLTIGVCLDALQKGQCLIFNTKPKYISALASKKEAAK